MFKITDLKHISKESSMFNTVAVLMSVLLDSDVVILSLEAMTNLMDKMYRCTKMYVIDAILQDPN